MDGDFEVEGLKAKLYMTQVMHKEALNELGESERRADEYRRLFVLARAHLRLLMQDREFDID